MDPLEKRNGAPCACGKAHRFSSQVIIGKGVVSKVPELVKTFGAKAYILSDRNTFAGTWAS